MPWWRRRGATTCDGFVENSSLTQWFWKEMEEGTSPFTTTVHDSRDESEGLSLAIWMCPDGDDSMMDPKWGLTFIT
ncbi:hypothetical protein VNO77_34429 [Canavalia gladiata]|uniref:Uncharacterized protein n=1 Tax=Canavalia gladiata TaxID=3824 RepID=A0AAN9KGB8_CANGL